MNRTCTLACISHQAVRRAEVPPRHRDLTALITVWLRRMRFCRELKRRSKTNSDLIDDSGLPGRQPGTGIAGSFWRL